MKRSFLSTCLAVLMTAGVQYGFAQVTQAFEGDLRRAGELASQGHEEQAVLSLKSLAKRASDQGDKRSATTIWLQASELMREMGQDEQVIDTLRQARPDAQGTDMEAMVEAFLDLGIARMWVKQARDETALLNCLRMLFKAEAELPKIPHQGRRLNAQSEEINERVDLYLEFLRRDLGSHFLGTHARDLSLRSQIFVISATSNQSPEEFENNLNIIREAIDAIDKKGRYQDGLLLMARGLNQDEMRVDEALAQAANNPSIGKLNLARDKSQLASVEDLSGNTDQAIRLRNEALQIYAEQGSFQDGMFEMGNLSLLYYKKGTPDARLAARQLLDNLVSVVEHHATAVVGQSMDDYLGQFHSAYVLLFYATLDSYRISRDDEALEAFVRQADDMNFRATRRDLSVYRDLGKKISADPAIAQRLEEQRGILSQAEEERDRAVEHHKSPQDLGLERGSPVAAVRNAKEGFVTILEDFERKVGPLTDTRHLLSLPEVRQGMTASDGIVMYLRQEPRPSVMYSHGEPPPDALSKPLIQAVVITAKNGRLVELNVEAETIGSLVADARKKLVLPDAAAAENLRNLARKLWQPLGKLPENLTIVLTPELVGLPFETLPDADGQPLVTGHNIRYAFGLAPGIGATPGPSDYKKAFVAGAEAFPQLHLYPLPWSATEVRSLRKFFNVHGVDVLPAGGDGLPEIGRPMFANGETVDIVHLSTHSVMDQEVPLLDSLAFPKDQIYAYDLALSPMRAKLVVLSACELFRPLDQQSYRDPAVSPQMVARTVSLFPVSGITTASLGSIAPQVVSTLWTISASPATELFMLRFYSELLKGKDPSAALALTKRDFLRPSQLKAWIDSGGITLPEGVQLDSYKDTYNWAPFVLAVGIPQN